MMGCVFQPMAHVRSTKKGPGESPGPIELTSGLVRGENQPTRKTFISVLLMALFLLASYAGNSASTNFCTVTVRGSAAAVVAAALVLLSVAGAGGVAGVAEVESIGPISVPGSEGVSGVAGCALICCSEVDVCVLAPISLCASAGVAANAKRLVAVNIRSINISIILSVLSLKIEQDQNFANI